MPEKPPFDPIRACFFLIAGVIAVQCVVILAGVAFCWHQADASRCTDLRAMLSELLMAAVASALAFVSGFSRGQPPPPPPPPPPPKDPPHG